ncbi:TonB-dependent receptor [Sphingomonas sp. Leaf62]|uniref:TonB-dependent receptor n=1 Tax=Sphingomonas sp. Leaf62 TaxID=1736228 RepID=UPI0009E68F99|nr:TonB-dependent receptor [Sphingomonas sp. Leaf62]
MRRFTLMASVAVVPIMLAAAPVFAQVSPTDRPVGADAGETVEVPDATKKDDEQSEILVRGLRRSLASSQAIKRNSDSIIDVIVADDIGKLPDYTAAESLARIAGVQVTRFSDEVNGVLIRGLPDVATSYNGRELFTAELRRVQLQDFPAQAIASMEVYKSGTADLVEPGLAGLINVRTRRPLDFNGRVIAGGFRGTYNDQSRKYDPGGNVLISDRWKVGDGEMGLLVNATFAQSQYYNGVRYNASYVRDSRYSDFGVQGAKVRDNFDKGNANGLFFFPNNVGLYNDGGKRYRPSGNFSLQYKPNPDTEIYVEGIYQGYRGRGYADNFDVPLEQWGPNSTPPVFTNVVLMDGQSYNDTKLLPGKEPPYDVTTVPQAVSLSKTSGSEPQGYRNTTQDQTNTYQIATGARWQTDRATLSTDLAYSRSRYTRDNYSLDFRTIGAKSVDVAFNRDGGVSFNFPSWDPFNPANYMFRGYYEATYDVKGDDWQWRGDLALDTDWAVLPKIQFGLRATKHHSERTTDGSRYAELSAALIPYASLPIGDLAKTIDPFRGSAQGFVSYLQPPRAGIYENREALRKLSYDTLAQLVARFPNDQGYKDRLAEWSTETVQPPTTSGWQADESTYAAYAQGKYNFALGGLEIDGVVGVRAVMTHGTSFGVSNICTLNDGGTPADPRDDTCIRSLSERTEKQDYLDILPNVSARFKFTPELQLRLGYTKTRTKPNFGDLNPALNIQPVIYQPCLEPTAPNYNPTDTTSCRIPGRIYPNYSGSQGNPSLKPFTSTNYDISLEWYFSKTGFVSASVFQRDIFGFTTGVQRFRNDPQFGILSLSSPINAGDANIKGAEANFQTFFDFLPGALSGFGVSGNVSYLTGKNRYPNGYNPNTDTFEGEGAYLTIPGLSKWTYNAALFYEKSGLVARVSYNRRSDWVNRYNTDQLSGFQYSGESTYARDRLDAGASYDINKNITVSADIGNILARPFRNYVNFQPGRSSPIDVRDEGRYYGVGLRFRFGD